MRSLSINTAFAALPLIFEFRASATPAPALNAMSYKGCFNSSEPLVDQGSYLYQTTGFCQPICVDMNKPVMGLSGGSDCWCGDLLPAVSSLVSDAECNSPCNGFGKQDCGGAGAWSVYTTGLNNNDNIPNIQAAPAAANTTSTPTTTSSSTTLSTTQKPSVSTTATPSVVTVGGSTVILTVPVKPTSTSSSAPKSSSSSPNTAGIAAGVVVGLVVIAAIVGGVFLFLRRRKRLAVEEEFKRSAAVEDFVGKGKRPANSGAGTADSRIDPFVMTSRRQSDGSLADDAEYGRRVLKVTNPDGN